MAFTGQELLEYACRQFENGAYDAALEAFILAYSKGYERDWVLENIYNCYMSGNEMEFRKTFQEWHYVEGVVSYEECLLDFVPYHEGEYYIFDKEIKEFRGIYSTEALQAAKRPEEFNRKEFSAIAIGLDWDWRKWLEILGEAKYRKVYVVCQSIGRCASFFKLPELQEYAANIILFPDMETFKEYFHEHTSEYLPKLFFGTEKEKNDLRESMNIEHVYRLTPEGRNTDNVILTIAIPTYNRGNLVLERLNKLLPILYDAEIEIAVSKNGMELYQEEYQNIAEITDARLVYYDHEKTLWSTENWRYTVSMSHGQYVVFVSDEDEIVLQSLEHYFRILTSYPNVNMVRAKSNFHYSFITDQRYGEKGLEAFKNVYLDQNYLSGLIVRRKDFMQEDFASLDRFSENEFYRNYPHEWWCAVLSQKGDSLYEPVQLVQEGEPVKEEEEQEGLPWYATYEERIRQFQGMVEFIHWLMDDNPEGIEVALEASVKKIMYLFDVGRYYKYDREHFGEWVNRFCELVINVINEFVLSEEQKIHLLQTLQYYCGIVLEKHIQRNAEEAEE